MPEKITILKEYNIIKVTSFGIIKIEELKILLQEYNSLIKNTEIKKILVDARQVIAYPTSGFLFEFARELAKTVYHISIAILPSPAFIRETKLFVTIANNRGAHMKIYDSEESAVKSLTEKPICV